MSHAEKDIMSFLCKLKKKEQLMIAGLGILIKKKGIIHCHMGILSVPARGAKRLIGIKSNIWKLHWSNTYAPYNYKSNVDAQILDLSGPEAIAEYMTLKRNINFSMPHSWQLVVFRPNLLIQCKQ
jgi:hypothetical protein